jgi:hypothetical protein
LALSRSYSEPGTKKRASALLKREYTKVLRSFYVPSIAA